MRVLILLAVLVLVPLATAIAITPAQQTIQYGIDAPEFTFRTLDSAAQVHIEGDLADYIVLDRSSLGPGESVHGKIERLPDVSPGPHEQFVVFVSPGQAGQFGASAAVASSLRIIIPYPDVYLESTWDATEDAGVLHVTVQVQNLGSEPAQLHDLALRLSEGNDLEQVVALGGGQVPAHGAAKFTRALETDLRGAYRGTLVADRDLHASSARVVLGAPRLVFEHLDVPAESGTIRPIDVSGTLDWNEPVALKGSVFVDGESLVSESFEVQGPFSHRFYVEPEGAEFSNVSVTLSGAGPSQTLTASLEKGASPRRLNLLILALTIALAALAGWWVSRKRR